MTFFSVIYSVVVYLSASLYYSYTQHTHSILDISDGFCMTIYEKSPRLAKCLAVPQCLQWHARHFLQSASSCPQSSCWIWQQSLSQRCKFLRAARESRPGVSAPSVPPGFHLKRVRNERLREQLRAWLSFVLFPAVFFSFFLSFFCWCERMCLTVSAVKLLLLLQHEVLIKHWPYCTEAQLGVCSSGNTRLLVWKCVCAATGVPSTLALASPFDCIMHTVWGLHCVIHHVARRVNSRASRLCCFTHMHDSPVWIDMYLPFHHNFSVSKKKITTVWESEVFLQSSLSFKVVFRD